MFNSCVPLDIDLSDEPDQPARSLPYPIVSSK
jgi:hypothetical protein